MKLTDMPNPRQVSIEVFTNKIVLAKKTCLFYMEWGQFIDHDFTLSPTYQAGTKAQTVDMNACQSMSYSWGKRTFMVDSQERHILFSLFFGFVLLSKSQ